MKVLRNLSISRRLWLILLLALGMLAALGLFMLKQIHDDLYLAKAQKTMHVVQTAAGLLEYFNGLEKTGALTHEVAQQQAIAAVRGLRYGGADYFWINDLRPVMVMHPTNAKLDGQDLSGIRDPDGFAVFNEMVAVAKAKGAGMVNYRWPKPGASAPVAKTSYVQLFQPWGWVIGSGVYVDDVEAEFTAQVVRVLIAAAVIALMMALAIVAIARSIVHPLRDSVSAMANIASGDGDLTRELHAEGNDEITQLSRHFNAFTRKMRAMVGSLQASADELGRSSQALAAMPWKPSQVARASANKWTGWPPPSARSPMVFRMLPAPPSTRPAKCARPKLRPSTARPVSAVVFSRSTSFPPPSTKPWR